MLIATDVAARGIDIPNVELIVQLEPPKDIEFYIHRSGRTARAGKNGTCVTLYDNSTKYLLEKIVDVTKISLNYEDAIENGFDGDKDRY